MKQFSFKGGIHPDDKKRITKDCEIKEVFPKDSVVIPLSQHIGAPASAIVEKGQRVLVGECIARSAGFISANIHSSVSGEVKDIKTCFSTAGFQVPCILIENDHSYEAVEFVSASIDDLTKEEIIERIKEAGIVGMGGAGFPCNVKLSPKDPDKIEYTIINAAECEPYITADYRRMLEQTDELIEGIKIVLKLFDNATALLGIENNKMDCFQLLKEKTKDDDKIKIIDLQTKYPQGSERQLISAMTNRTLNSSMLPSDIGCVVNNVETLIAIKHAVLDGVPAYKRVITLSGDCVEHPGNYLVSIGMSHQELVEEAGGFKVEPQKIISGGPMMGFSIFNLDTPLTKTSSSIVCLANDEVSKCDTTACINCGRCVEVCPSRIVPSRLAKAADHGDEKGFEDYFGLECIECGSCSFVCPAKKHLKQSISIMKRKVLAKRRGK